MFKKILFTLCLGASALSVANAGSQEVIESVLKDSDLKFQSETGEVVTRFNDGCTVVCRVDDEQSIIRVYGYSVTEVPIAKWSQAYEKLNELSRNKHMCFYLDSDGDVFVDIVEDMDEMKLSKPAFLATFHRVVKCLVAAREAMMKVRYQND